MLAALQTKSVTLIAWLQGHREAPAPATPVVSERSGRRHQHRRSRSVVELEWTRSNLG